VSLNFLLSSIDLSSTELGSVALNQNLMIFVVFDKN